MHAAHDGAQVVSYSPDDYPDITDKLNLEVSTLCAVVLLQLILLGQQPPKQ